MISFKTFFLAASAAAAFAGTAQSAVVRYDYAGAPLYCDGDPASTACNGRGSAPGFFGQVTIDTAFFDAGSPMFFRINAASSDSGNVYSYRAAGFDGVQIGDDGFADITDIPFFVAFSGSIGRFLRPGDVGPNALYLGFERNGEVRLWRGSDTDGGSTDQYISPEGDSIGGSGSTGSCTEKNICTRVPGVWTRTVLNTGPVEAPAPAPVPLPAGGLLLAAALATLGLRRRGSRT